MLSNRILNKQELRQARARIEKEFPATNTQQIRTPRYLDLKRCQILKQLLQKRLKRRHFPPSARETGKESSIGKRVKTMGTFD